MQPEATPLGSAYVDGRERWPALALPPGAFEKQMDRLRVDEAHLAARASDLFLVAAVLEEVPGALAALDELLGAAVAVVARVDAAPAFSEDVKQEVRLKLLTGEAPRLLGYSGRGALVDWLRVVAMRAALNLKRSDHLHPTADVPEAILAAEESAQLGRRYLGDLQAALEAGFRRLSPRERTLLRLHFLDRLNIERMADIYGVGRATIGRWLVGVRRRLFEEVRGELGAKHGLDTADVRSLYRRLEREVHVSVSRILQG